MFSILPRRRNGPPFSTGRPCIRPAGWPARLDGDVLISAARKRVVVRCRMLDLGKFHDCPYRVHPQHRFVLLTCLAGTGSLAELLAHEADLPSGVGVPRCPIHASLSRFSRWWKADRVPLLPKDDQFLGTGLLLRDCLDCFGRCGT